MSSIPRELFSVEVSEDRMCAYIKCCKLGGYSAITAGQVAAVLESASIEITDQVTHRILDFTERVKRNGPSDTPFEVATGEPPQAGSDASFVWDQRYRNHLPKCWDVPSKPSFYDIRAFTEVEKGARLGELVRSVDGKDGCDVLGNPVPQDHIPRDLVPGEGLAVEEGTGILTAQKNGRVEIKGSEISIGEYRVLEGDLKLQSGNIREEASIRVRGNVCDINIDSEQSVTVDGAIEAANLTAGIDVIIGDGITGRNRTKIVAGGEIVARFCEGATLKAGKDVRILTSFNQSDVYAMGRVDVADGVIMGGSVYARDGITAKVIGSEMGVKTIVRVGIHPDARALLSRQDQEIQAKQKVAMQIRATVEPLMAQLKRLTSPQREKATELLYQADEIALDIDGIKAEQAKILQKMKPGRPAFVEVVSKLYRGTTLHFDEHAYAVEDELRGPVLIRLMGANGRQAVVAVNTFTKTQKVLPTKKRSRSDTS